MRSNVSNEKAEHQLKRKKC